MRTRAELILLVALLIAAWLVASRGGRAPAPGADQPQPSGATRSLAPIDGRFVDRAQALRALVATPRPRGPLARNPFGFRPNAPSPGPRARVRAAALPAPDPTPTRPDMMLAGIAEETGDGHPVRTAVISSSGQLVFAREGDRVLSRFLVLRIAADAVQLKDADGGEVFTLALR